MPNHRLDPARPRTRQELNRRIFDKRKRLGKCVWCCGDNDRQPRVHCSLCAKRLLDQRKENKRKVFEHYGGVICECCGCGYTDMLTLDHFTRLKSQDPPYGGDKLYNWIIRHGFPEGYRVLCFNCNTARYINGGLCPHAS